MYILMVPLLYLLAAHWQMNRSLKQSLGQNETVLIILGSKIVDGKITPILKSRLDKGLELWRQNQDLKVIVSGGDANSPTMLEAQLMHDYLLEQGMDPQKIYLEDKSKNTYENLRNCRGMVCHRCTIISSDFHTLRTAFLAKRLGLKAQIIGAKTPRGRRFKHEAREHLAIIKSWFCDKEQRG